MYSEEIKKSEIISSGLPEMFEIPPAFRELSLTSLSLSVRLANVLRSLNFQALGDLHGMSVKQFKSIRHCGEKSLRELISIIEKLKKNEDNKGLIELGIVDASAELTLSQFVEFFDEFWAEQKPRTQEILLKRYGGDSGKLKTLEEVSHDYNLSRERIRQVTSRVLNEFKLRLGQAGERLFERLKRESLEAVCPLNPQLLVLRTGKDISDFRLHPSIYLRIIWEFVPEMPVMFKDGFFMSSSLPKRVHKISHPVRNLLARSGALLTLRDVFEEIKKSAQFKDLSSAEFLAAFRYTRTFNLKLDVPDKPTIELTAKPKLAELAYLVLSESETPLKAPEIIKRAKEIFGKFADKVSVGGLLQLTVIKDEFFLLDKRTIGLKRHFSFPQEEQGKVKKDIYKLLKKSERSYSTIEIVRDKLFPWTDKINASELAQILSLDARFSDLGRRHYALAVWNVKKRLRPEDLVIKILQAAERPLKPLEIVTEIRKYRFLRETSGASMLRRVPGVVNFNYGFYGLEEKGLKNQEYLVTNKLYVRRVVRDSSIPLRFDDLCEIMGISGNRQLIASLWKTLRAIPKLKLSSDRKSAGALIFLKSYQQKSRRKNINDVNDVPESENS